MGTALAILMALAIYVVAPTVLGLAIVGLVILKEHWARRARHVVAWGKHAA